MSPLLTCCRPKSLTIQLLATRVHYFSETPFIPSTYLIVPLPEPGAPMMRVLALLPLDMHLDTVTASTVLLLLFTNKLDSRLLENMISEILNYLIRVVQYVV